MIQKSLKSSEASSSGISEKSTLSQISYLSLSGFFLPKFSLILKKESPESEPTFCERFAYYERAKKAYAVIITGEERQYANIILKKGCVLPGM